VVYMPQQVLLRRAQMPPHELANIKPQTGDMETCKTQPHAAAHAWSLTQTPHPTPPHRAQNLSLARRTAASTSTGSLAPANFCSAGWSQRRKGLYVLSPCAERVKCMSLVAVNKATLLCVSLWWLFRDSRCAYSVFFGHFMAWL